MLCFRCCILSKFYIKPQPLTLVISVYLVVSYRNSTSNHNYLLPALLRQVVVSYRNSTSNHNGVLCHFLCIPLYLIEILHQTTTSDVMQIAPTKLYLIEILHQTTTPPTTSTKEDGCILSKFYIKPQQSLIVPRETPGCILSKFYIKPQLLENSAIISNRCILSKFYIKPQQQVQTLDVKRVVSYRNSTSNHNDFRIDL